MGMRAAWPSVGSINWNTPFFLVGFGFLAAMMRTPYITDIRKLSPPNWCIFSTKLSKYQYFLANIFKKNIITGRYSSGAISRPQGYVPVKMKATLYRQTMDHRVY